MESGINIDFELLINECNVLWKLVLAILSYFAQHFLFVVIMYVDLCTNTAPSSCLTEKTKTEVRHCFPPWSVLWERPRIYTALGWHVTV